MVELLAPAGDKACFRAALMAGADAVYVGGKKYGARAYAGNFETEDLTECLRLAHLLGKKVYLTVNTLMKESELEELTAFLRPFYEEGLDGVIVQDFGALRRIREAFPDMELHASTQMTVTGVYGASLLKQYGVSRVVPARELSLAEMIDIKDKTGLEIEAFVHGAMCYGYSGQCLFSSMLGERSGNRGRCAGPCRLPYTVSYDGKRLNGPKEMYPLSLKDLCTLEVLPQLIDAGIDSFKIEGRMKTAEYVSFVTAMYRKYIDLYHDSPKHYKVTKEDMELLRRNFSRGSIQPGYYFQHNGRELVTLDKPGYRSFTAEHPEAVRQSPACDADAKEPRIDLIGHFYAGKEAPLCFTVYKKSSPQFTVVATGDVPSEAQKCAATPDDVRKQLAKTGNTCFRFAEITFDMEDGLFLPNKMLNDLRRDALSQLEDLLLEEYRRERPKQAEEIGRGKEIVQDAEDVGRQEAPKTQKSPAARMVPSSQSLQVEVRTLAQFQVIAGQEGLQRVYLSTDSFEASSAGELAKAAEICRSHGTEVYLSLPRVCRQKTINIITQHRSIIEAIMPKGFCVGNLESLAYVKEAYPDKALVTDAGFHLCNGQTAAFFTEHGAAEHILSYELHKKEIEKLSSVRCTDKTRYILPVYGYIPVMESAGCVLKTNGVCRAGKGSEHAILTDRYKKDRIVLTHCDRCENTIYNSVPLSLHKEAEQIRRMSVDGLLIRFTVEKKAQMQQILAFWHGHLPMHVDTVYEFTKGHFTKGVE